MHPGSDWGLFLCKLEGPYISQALSTKGRLKSVYERELMANLLAV